jgi:small-conductance mechanosensitive channel
MKKERGEKYLENKKEEGKNIKPFKKEDKKQHGFKIVIRNLFIGLFSIGILYLIVEILKNFQFFGPYNGLIKDIFYVALVIVSTFFISKIAGEYLTREVKTIRKIEKTPILLNKVVYIIGFIIATLIIFGYFNIALTPILTAMGIVGIALGLALQPTLSNFFAGLIILSENSIEVGDHLEIDDMSGYVEDINWRATTIRTLPNNIVVIPNSKIIDSVMTNHWSQDKVMSSQNLLFLNLVLQQYY